jgi:hypothetical protein
MTLPDPYAAFMHACRRDTIVEALAARGMARARLAELAGQARALVDALGGLQKLRPQDATRLEAEAVTAQQTRWAACRRMIRAAVAGDPELSAAFAAC